MEDKIIAFILKSNIVHDGKYTYLKSKYVNAVSKICITCPIHGDFFIRPNNHLSGQGCKKCGVLKRFQNKPKSVERFILDANSIHKNKYDYSKLQYFNNSTKVEIICRIHGSFWMRPIAHLNGQGCPLCGRNHNKSVQDYPYKVKTCDMCGIEKFITDYYIDSGYYRGKCKECEKKIKVEYRKNPINKERTRIYHKRYKKERRKNDPVFRLRMDIPTMIRRAIKKKYYNSSIWKYLPYTPLDLKEHLEKLFDNNMTWDNHGSYWHIDHIIPQAVFRYDCEKHPDFLKCWSLENLRPIKAEDNLKKSSIYKGERITSKIFI